MVSYKVYGIYKKISDELLYIGMTRKSIKERFKHHTISWLAYYNDSKIYTYMRDNGGYDEYYIKSLLKFRTEMEARVCERLLIREMDPPCNILCKRKCLKED